MDLFRTPGASLEGADRKSFGGLIIIILQKFCHFVGANSFLYCF